MVSRRWKHEDEACRLRQYESMLKIEGHATWLGIVAGFEFNYDLGLYKRLIGYEIWFVLNPMDELTNFFDIHGDRTEDVNFSVMPLFDSTQFSFIHSDTFHYFLANLKIRDNYTRISSYISQKKTQDHSCILESKSLGHIQ
ncbi:hypothetical protein M5K25_013546 [Dendrobium thyrsiflorum]|uniref:Uncharacterized protein n=1 Tax=Dendrobium thyrsiflorum TaxID=117978 RepID=A0ABD0V169_DENTH